MFKLYNLNPTYNASTNPNNLVLDPADDETRVLVTKSQIFEIVIPIYDYLPPRWRTVGVSNPAIIDKAQQTVDIPKIQDGGVLNISFSAEKNTDKEPILEISWRITKMEMSNTAAIEGASYAVSSFSRLRKEVQKFNNSGVRVIGNHLKIYLEANFYGNTDTKLSYDTLYNFLCESLIESEKYNFVDVITSGNDANVNSSTI